MLNISFYSIVVNISKQSKKGRKILLTNILIIDKSKTELL